MLTRIFKTVINGLLERTSSSIKIAHRIGDMGQGRLNG